MAEPAWFEIHAVVRTTPELLEQARAALENGDLAELATFDVTPLDANGRRWDGTQAGADLEHFDALRRGINVDP